jgi:tetratricopeptide (TPR) repeat protein
MGLRAWPRFLLILGGLSLGASGIASGQEAPVSHPPKSQMRQHYDAAFRFQSTGDLSRANSEYKVFLSMALHRLANGNATLGDYGHAASLYEEALRLNPDERSLQVDYAGAALDASDWRKAKALAGAVLASLKNEAQPPDGRAVSTLAQAQLELGEHQEALELFRMAAQLRPGFEASSQLAAAYLVLGNRSSAAQILDEMPKKFGDTAELHLQLGILYGRTKFFDDAIEEFGKALAKDSHLKGAHYSLGASYMMQSGQPGFDKAEAEFRKEIAINPDNPLAYTPLARIALARHLYPEAEAYMKHALTLKEKSAGAYLMLGQIYRDTGRTAEAERAFRESISLTLDPSMNDYEVEQTHFWLGRLLIQDGNSAEGRSELELARNLLYLKEQQLESRLSGNNILRAALDRTHEAKPEDLEAQKASEKQAGPMMASSYCNLGVNAANAGKFADASRDFEQAARWNPTLAGVNENWSRAAFAAKEYARAVAPLSHTLDQHPENAEVRSMLGFSLYMIHDYPQALRVLQPMEAHLGENPLLRLAYAGSMALAGDYSQGLTRLEALEEAGTDAAIVHYLLGEAYARKNYYVQSAEELHTALTLDPSSADTKNALATVDLALGKKEEALSLLYELAGSGLEDADAYDRLGRLQIELGLWEAAVGNLETAIHLDPMNAGYHRELAEAYQKNAQPDEAARETRQSETLQAQIESTLQPGSRNSARTTHSGNGSKTQRN